MTKISSVVEPEETAKAIIENVRHYATPHQHPDNSAEAKAYLEGVNTAMAMLYIDLTGTPKVKGFLTTYAETQRLALLTELRDSGLLENKPMNVFSFVLQGEELEHYMRYKGHNLAVEAIKAHLDELIKSTSI